VILIFVWAMEKMGRSKYVEEKIEERGEKK